MKTMTPGVGVLALVWRDGQVLLVRRRNPPQALHWGFPGGRVEPGERLAAAAQRELWEETGIRGRALPPLPLVEAISEGWHWVLVPIPCVWETGEPVAASDASEAGWFSPEALPSPLCHGVAPLVAASRPLP